MDQIKTVYDLKYTYYQKHPNGHFFDRDTLKFFGETLSKMYLFKQTRKIRDCMGDVHTCYTLSSLQRNNPMGPRRAYHYFDIETLDNVIPGAGA